MRLDQRIAPLPDAHPFQVLLDIGADLQFDPYVLHDAEGNYACIDSSGGVRYFHPGSVSPTVQKVQMVVKQAMARAGIEIEVKAIPASVFFSADPNNVDTNVRFHADLQMYTTFTWLDPQFFMAQFCSLELPTRDNKWSWRNITRWRSAEYDRLWRDAETEMDPVKRGVLFIRMNDLVVQSGVVIPVTWRNVLHAVSNQIGGVQSNSWDSILGSIAYWYRQS